MAYGSRPYPSHRGASPPVRTIHHRPRRRPPLRRVPGFDGLRIVAALALVAYHALGRLHPHADPAVGVGLPAAAYVFFLISGFVIHRPLAAAHLGGRPDPDPFRFWAGRCRRVFPLWWTALAVYLLVERPHALHSPAEIACTALLLHYAVPHLRFAVIGPAWALSVEWLYYLAAPLLNLAARSLHRLAPHRLGALGAQAALLGGLAFLCLATGPLRPFLGIVAGMALAVLDVVAARQPNRPVPAVVRSPWPAVAVTAAVWPVLVRWTYGPGISAQWVQRDLRLALLWLVLALAWFVPVAFADERSPISRVLGSSPARRAAELTFGIYLWHQLVLERVISRLGADAPAITIVYLTALGATALAAIGFVAVERPTRGRR